MSTSSNIVFPVDFSGRCVKAAVHVCEWAKRFSAPVKVLHVLDPRDFSASPADDVDRFSDKLPTYVAKAKQELDYFCASHMPGVDVQPLVTSGDTAERIVEHAAFNKAAIIMIPRNHQGLVSRWVHDSVTSTVLETSSVSVWNTEYLDLVRPIQHVLCALEVVLQETQDAENVKILNAVKKVATAFGAATTILCVVEKDKAGVEERLKSLEAQTAGFADLQIVAGDVGDEISLAASRTRADLIVMGRTALDAPGLTRQAHILTVNHRARCPVLSVF